MNKYSNDQGKWLQTGIKSVPVGELEWFEFRDTHVAMLGKKTIATIRNRIGNIWLATMPGWMWEVKPDMPTARFKGIKETTVKGFKNPKQARKAIEEAYKLLKGD